MLKKWVIKKAKGDFLGEKEFTVRFKKPIEVELQDEPFPGYEILVETKVPETENPENQIFWGTPGETVKAIYTVKEVIPPDKLVIKA